MSNPRLTAIECERRRGCSFAESFVSETKLALNDGVITGSGASVSRGITVDGTQHVDFDIIGSTLPATAVVKFSASEASDGILFGNANLISGTPADGFCIWVDADGVRATYSDGVSIETALEIDLNYADEENHVVTYSIGSSSHALYVDGESVTASVSTSGPIGATTALMCCGDGTDNFIGTIYMVRLFDAELSDSEHLFYYGDFQKNWKSDAFAIWNCSSFGDDTDGNYIWERLDLELDLVKGDGSIASTFPSLASIGDGSVEYYEFDGVDDYVSGWPTMPSEYTVSLAKSDSYPDGTTEIQQVNDDTVESLLTTPGSFSGNMHSLMIYDSELGTLQKYHLEHLQLARLRRLDNIDAFSGRIIRDLSAVLWCGYDTADTGDDDRSTYGQAITKVGATWDDGAEFASGQYFLVDYASEMQLDEFTIHAVFDSPGGCLCDRDTHFSIAASGSVLWQISGSVTPAFDFWPLFSATFVFKKGEKAQVYHDGIWVAETTTVVSMTEISTSDIRIGNELGAGSNPWTGKLRRFVWCKGTLTPFEIKALHLNTILDWI